MILHSYFLGIETFPLEVKFTKTQEIKGLNKALEVNKTHKSQRFLKLTRFTWPFSMVGKVTLLPSRQPESHEKITSM